MKKIRTILWVCLIGLWLSPQVMFAGNGFARQDGHWNDPETWLFNGDGRKPGCGDTLRIDAGIAVTITAQENYSRCTEPLILYIGGALQFINGFKLDLPAGSVVNVLPGGVVRKITPGGGNSTLISICGGVAWSARQGDLFGPAVLVCLSPLPVSLLSWEGHAGDGSIDLLWSTGSEQNNDHFEIEKSKDGMDFRLAAIVAGSGSTAVTHAYGWKDVFPTPGMNYYRLTQVDFDGLRTSYDAIAIQWKDFPVLFVAPNPATDGKINILFTGEPETGRLQLADAMGRIVYSEAAWRLSPGTNTLIPSLPDGLYLLVFESIYTKHTEKVFIDGIK